MLIRVPPAIGDIAIIEGWPLAEMMQLFPNSPDIQRDWSRKSQLFSLSDLNGKHSVTRRACSYPKRSDALILP